MSEAAFSIMAQNWPWSSQIAVKKICIVEINRRKSFCSDKKNFVAPYYEWGSTVLRLQSHFEEAVYVIPLTFQKFLVLILLASEG